MKYLFWGLGGLICFWMEVVLNPTFQILGFKIQFSWIALVIMILRWPSMYLVFYGLILGLMKDSFSHSMLGLYGISFFLTLIVGRKIGESFYESNVFSTMIFVVFLSLMEGALAVLLLKFLLTGISWTTVFMQTVVPLSLVQGVVSPFVFFLLIRMESRFHLNPEGYG